MDISKHARKVNEAVQAGLARCRHSVAPLVALSRFVDDLHTDPTWREEDVAAVEEAVRHVLARVVLPAHKGA